MHAYVKQQENTTMNRDETIENLNMILSFKRIMEDSFQKHTSSATTYSNLEEKRTKTILPRPRNKEKCDVIIKKINVTFDVYLKTSQIPLRSVDA